MTDQKYLRHRLEDIIARTSDHAPVAPGGFIGNKPSEAQFRDNLAAGRIQWRWAHNRARLGLDALDRGDLDLAEAAMCDAEEHQRAAYEARMTAADYRALATPARRRGRRVTTADRNQRLAAAYDDALAQGKKGRAARIAAVDSDPDLKREFEGTTDGARKKAIELGRNLRKK